MSSHVSFFFFAIQTTSSAHVMNSGTEVGNILYRFKDIEVNDEFENTVRLSLESDRESGLVKPFLDTLLALSKGLIIQKPNKQTEIHCYEKPLLLFVKHVESFVLLTSLKANASVDSHFNQITKSFQKWRAANEHTKQTMVWLDFDYFNMPWNYKEFLISQISDIASIYLYIETRETIYDPSSYKKRTANNSSKDIPPDYLKTGQAIVARYQLTVHRSERKRKLKMGISYQEEQKEKMYLATLKTLIHTLTPVEVTSKS